MTILGLGLDVVETKRISESIARYGDRFLERLFLPAEIAYARGMKASHIHFAARFAAKEAISKAFGTGIGEEMGWRDLEIIRQASGAPCVQLHGKAEGYAKTRGVEVIHLSLTHTAEYAAASVVLVGFPQAKV